MIKPILLTCSLCFAAMICSAQETAMWEMTIYVEDAAGNRDSVVIGVDTSASATEVNTQFGEEDISHVPWDSVFEVRAANLVDVQFTDELETPFFQSKKAIGRIPSVHVFDDCIRTSQIPPLVVKAVHLPIKISWDSTKYDNRCMVRSYISTHRFPSIYDWWTDFQYLIDETRCMKDTNTFTTSLPYLPGFEPGFGLMAKIVDIEGGGRDTVKGVQIYSAGNGFIFTPCEHVGITAVDEVEGESPSQLIVYPNPARDVLHIEGSDLRLAAYSIYDMQGRMQYFGTERQVDVQSLLPGVYLLVVITDEGESIYEKFYKR